MYIGVNSTKFYSVYCWKVKVKGSENTKHTGTGEHYMEMTNYVKGVMEQDI